MIRLGKLVKDNDNLDRRTLVVIGMMAPESRESSGKAVFGDFVRSKAVRTVIFRIGFTLGRNGGALATLSKLARGFLDGAAGEGRQFISWIHIGVLNAMFQRAIEYPSMTGIYNATGPAPVTNSEFMKELRAAVGRHRAPPTPAFAVKIGAFLMGTGPAWL